jgi:ubiquitin carboxyl-terminal hydrolase 36/42
MRKDFSIEGQQQISKSAEPFYLIDLEIPRECYDLQDCLYSFFSEKKVHDYKFKGKNVGASQRYMFEKLPNVLCIHIKRFIYTNERVIKAKEHIDFDEVLTIDDNYLSPSLKLGIFNKERKELPKYRLFSVVEHVGMKASSGHYVSHTMDCEDCWKKMDDRNVRNQEIESVLDKQAYILFYELMQED